MASVFAGSGRVERGCFFGYAALVESLPGGGGLVSCICWFCVVGLSLFGWVFGNFILSDSFDSVWSECCVLASLRLVDLLQRLVNSGG